MGLTLSKRVAGGYTLTTAGGLKASERMNRGTAPVGSFDLADGTGSGQANCVFAADFSIATTAFQLYDLKGGGGELDVVNVALAMTAVKEVLIQITTPGASTSIRFGPQAQTNAAQLWFQAATTNFWQEIRNILWAADPVSGWALDSTHKVIALYNPGGSTVAGKIRVTGTK